MGTCIILFLFRRSRISAQIALSCGIDGVIGSSVRKRLNGCGRLLAGGCYEITSVHEKQIIYIVRAAEFIDHRRLGIAAHAAGSHEMAVRKIVFDAEGLSPDFLRARSFEYFDLFCDKPL